MLTGRLTTKLVKSKHRRHKLEQAVLILISVFAGVACQPRVAVSPTPPATDVETQRIPTPLEPPPPAPRPAADAATWWQEQAPAGVRSAAAMPSQNIYYDRNNPSYGTLQKANQALKGFPLLRHDELDWVTTLRRGMIQPRTSLSNDSQMMILDRDIVMKNTKLMPHVRFPHRAHTEWLACSNCHDQIFVSKAGANRTTMSAILGGESCGVCHNKVAFSTLACGRCHNVPRE